MNKKYYLIYQITNNVNGKIYIGKHETFNVDDNYFGSGKYLKRSIKKHGLENFTKTILIELQNREEMNLLESQLSHRNFVQEKMFITFQKVVMAGGMVQLRMNLDVKVRWQCAKS